MYKPEFDGSDGKPADFYYAGPRVMSSWAVLSAIFALLSPIGLCLCGFPTVIMSFVAIVAGHVSLISIGRSAGQVTGRGVAWLGLVVGYLMFTCSLAIVGFFLLAAREDVKQTVQANTEASSTEALQLLREAEMNIVESKDGVASGNSIEALEVAAEFTKLMRGMRDVLFTNSEDRFGPLAEDNFVTHCELSPDACALIVYVPSYHEFDEETQDHLATVAWTVAQGTVSEHLEAGDRLAVGLRGILIYGTVLLGEVRSQDDLDEADDQFKVVGRDELPAFFLPRTAETDTLGRPARIPLGPNAESRQNAPEVKLTDSVPSSREMVQEFPKMGWAVQSLAFAPHGRWLAAGKLDRTLLILDVETGETLSSIKKRDDLQSLDQVAFSPDGSYVAAAGSTGAVVLWKIDETGELSEPRTLNAEGNSLHSLAFSTADPILVAGADKGQLSWHPYDQPDATPVKESVLTNACKAVYVTKRAVLVTDGQKLVHVDLKTKKSIEMHEFPITNPQAAAFSPAGDRLAITNGYQVEVWDTRNGSCLMKLDGNHEMQWSVAFLPDGKRLISGGRGHATLWDLESRAAECRFDLGGIQYIKTFAISPEGTRLAAIPASAGQTLTVLRIPE